jgi:hypothetical protein
MNWEGFGSGCGQIKCYPAFALRDLETSQKILAKIPGVSQTRTSRTYVKSLTAIPTHLPLSISKYNFSLLFKKIPQPLDSSN